MNLFLTNLNDLDIFRNLDELDIFRNLNELKYFTKKMNYFKILIN